MFQVRTLLLPALLAAAILPARAEEAPQQAALLQLVQSYADAQIDFAPAKIDAVVTRDFIEVSPAGKAGIGAVHRHSPS